jgi:methanogenic corrinoid protein MtbC1
LSSIFLSKGWTTLHVWAVKAERIAAAALPRHPIAVVSERTGLSHDVLRIWERRYRAVTPTRTSGGERLYSDADVERLRLLDAAVAAGRRIGRVATLPTSDLAELVAGDRAAKDRSAVEAAPGVDADKSFIETALDRIQTLDARGLDELLRRSAAVIGTPAFLEQSVVPLLRDIGDHWHSGRLSIAEEHMASAIIEAFIVAAIQTMAVPDGAPLVLVATPVGSRHVIGAALVGAATAAVGWRPVFLGGDVPTAEIARAAIAGSARAVALSVVYAEDVGKMLGELGQLREQLPAHVAVIVGGRAVLPHARALERIGIAVGETIDGVGTILHNLPGTSR